MWKITLNDGTILDNLTLSGNNFISQTEITPAMFTGKLKGVVIECDDENPNDEFHIAGTHEHMRLDAIMKYPDGWHIILNDIPATEIEAAKNRADLEYLAMMMDVEL